MNGLAAMNATCVKRGSQSWVSENASVGLGERLGGCKDMFCQFDFPLIIPCPQFLFKHVPQSVALPRRNQRHVLILAGGSVEPTKFIVLADLVSFQILTLWHLVLAFTGVRWRWRHYRLRHVSWC